MVMVTISITTEKDRGPTSGVKSISSNELAPKTNLIKIKFTTNLSYDTSYTSWPRSSAG